MTDDTYAVDADGDAEDVTYDDTETAKDKIAALKEKLATCQTERQEYLDGWQRAKADLINAKKRALDDQGLFLERIGTSFVEELLPVLDSFDMAFKNKEAWEAAPEQWRKGVEYIHSQLVGILTGRGVTVIDPVGKPFDHNEHHSVASVAVSDAAQDGVVLSVVRKGYKSGTTVIRPADVQVGSVS